MSLTVNISKLNPIRLREENFVEPIYENAFHAEYFQKFQIGDETGVQFCFHGEKPSSFTSTLVNQKTNEHISQSITTSVTIGDHHYYGTQIKFNVQEGDYRLVITANTVQYISDVLCVKERHPDTMLFHYKNSENTQEVYFAGGRTFELRVEADMTYNALKPNSENTIYESDFGDFTQIFSTPYDTFNINIGGTTGIPDWLLSIVNRMFSCDMIYVKNGRITKIEGSELEANSEDNYNLRSWNMPVSVVGNQFLYNDAKITVNGQTVYTPSLSSEKKDYGIVIFSERGYSVTSKPSWASVAPSPGTAGIVAATLEVELNNSNAVREGVIVLSDIPGNTAQIILKQPNTYITVNDKNPFDVNVSADAQTIPVTVKSSSAWNVVGSLPAGVLMNYQSGEAGSKAVNISIPANNTGMSRVLKITLNNGYKNCVITLHQQYMYFFPQSNNYDILISNAGGTVVEVIRSSSNWTMSYTPGWVSVTPTGGGDYKQIAIKIAKNSVTEIRGETLYFQNGNAQFEIYIEQSDEHAKYLVDKDWNNIVDKEGNKLIVN